MTERFSASDPTGEWVTVMEAARRLGISRQAVQQRYERGVLPRRGRINAPAGEPSIIEDFIRDPNTVSVQARATPTACKVTDEVIALLQGSGATMTVTIEIAADFADGAPDQIVRAVLENGRALSFDDSGFEES